MHVLVQSKVNFLNVFVFGIFAFISKSCQLPPVGKTSVDILITRNGLNGLAVFLLVGISTAIAKPVGTCSSSVTYLADTVNCSIYYQCVWGDPVEMYCPNGLHFNTNLHVCDWPQNVECISENNIHSSTEASMIYSTTVSYDSVDSGCSNAKCPYYFEQPAFVTFFPHDTDCSKYCMCDLYSVARAMSCPDGLYWNTNLDTCDWASNTDCSNSSSYNVTTAETTSSSSTTKETSDNTADFTTKKNLAFSSTASTLRDDSTTKSMETAPTDRDSTTMRSTTVVDSEFSINTTPETSAATNPKSTQSTAALDDTTTTNFEYTREISYTSSTNSTTGVVTMDIISTRHSSEYTFPSNYATETVSEFSNTASTGGEQTITEVSVTATSNEESDPTIGSSTATIESASSTDSTTDIPAVSFTTTQATPKCTVDSDDHTEKTLDILTTVATTRKDAATEVSFTDTSTKGTDTTFISSSSTETNSASSTNSATDISANLTTTQQNSQSTGSSENTEIILDGSSTSSTLEEDITTTDSITDTSWEESDTFTSSTTVTMTTDSTIHISTADFTITQDDSQPTVSSTDTTEKSLEFSSIASTTQENTVTTASFTDAISEGSDKTSTISTTIINSSSSTDSTTSVADYITTQESMYSRDSPNYSTDTTLFFTTTNDNSESTDSSNEITKMTSEIRSSASTKDTTTDFTVTVDSSQSTAPSSYTSETNLEFSSATSTAPEVTTTEVSSTDTSSEEDDETSMASIVITDSSVESTTMSAADYSTTQNSFDPQSTPSLYDTTEATLEFFSTTPTAHINTATEVSSTDTSREETSTTFITSAIATHSESSPVSTTLSTVSEEVSTESNLDISSTASTARNFSTTEASFTDTSSKGSDTTFISSTTVTNTASSTDSTTHISAVDLTTTQQNSLSSDDTTETILDISTIVPSEDTTESILDISSTDSALHTATEVSVVDTSTEESDVTFVSSTTVTDLASSTDSSVGISAVDLTTTQEISQSTASSIHTTPTNLEFSSTTSIADKNTTTEASFIDTTNEESNLISISTTEVTNSAYSTDLITDTSTVDFTTIEKNYTTSTVREDANTKDDETDRTSTTETPLQFISITSTVREDSTTESSVTEASNENSDSTIINFTTAEDTESHASSTTNIPSTISLDNSCSNVNCPYYPAPPANVTILPSTYCTKYCMCDWYGQVHVMTCPDGLYWSEKLYTCDWPFNVHCTDSLTSEGINSESTTLTSMEKSTSTKAQPEVSTDSTTDEPLASATSSSHNCNYVNCPEYPTPPANVTIFPYDNDCTKYCMCDWYGRVQVMNCPGGLFWSSQLYTCDFPSNVYCESSLTTEHPNSERTQSTAFPHSKPSDYTTSSTFETSLEDITVASIDATTEIGLTDTKSSTTVTDSPSSIDSTINMSAVEYTTTEKALEFSSTASTGTINEIDSTKLDFTTIENGYQSTAFPNTGCSNVQCPYYSGPLANVTFFPYDSDCTKYCMCDWYSSVHVMNCPGGLYWNSDLNVCDWPSNVNCRGSFSIKVVDNKNTTGTLSEESVNTTISSIINEKSEHTTSPEYNSQPTTLLDISSTTDAQSYTKTSPSTVHSYNGCDNIQCNSYFGHLAYVMFHPYANDNTKYCMCDWNGRLYVRHCPKGLHWNRYLSACDWPSNVNYSAVIKPLVNKQIVHHGMRRSDTSVANSVPNASNLKPESYLRLSSEASSTTYSVTTDRSLVQRSDHGCNTNNCPYFPKPPIDITYFAHNNDCRKFCVCNWDGTVLALNCAKGLYWNRNLDVCDRAVNVKC